MSNSEHDSILAFDTLFTNNSIQKLKLIMPLMDAQRQKSIAIYIKFMELQYTISYFHSHSFSSFSGARDIESVCLSMKSYCTQEERQRMEQMQNLFSTMNNYKEMMEMMSMMKDIIPEGEGGFDPEMLSELLGDNMGSLGPGMDSVLQALSSMQQTEVSAASQSPTNQDSM